MEEKRAIIIGAGPAGLTAAYELLEKTDIKPVVFEASSHIGGISRTEEYKGNRIDIGGHRFFSKSDRVMRWWLNILPLQGAPSKDDIKLGREIALSDDPEAPDPEKTDKVMLLRRRVSRIYFSGKFIDYPVSLSVKTLASLGILKVIKITASYLKAMLFPVKEEKNLEDFFINRFGSELYLTLFKDYTRKVWGMPCTEISAEWGIQRVKGLSMTRAITHSVKKILSFSDSSIRQKNTETSLIERFMYPKLGPGQLWEEVASRVKEKGGRIYLNKRIVGLRCRDEKLTEAETEDTKTGETHIEKGDYFFSSMPVRDLMQAMEEKVPEDVLEVAKGLVYRDFITVGLLLKGLKIRNTSGINTVNDIIPDEWIYIQEKGVKIGRVQVFNNWSPYMVKDENTVWIGGEYFCDEGDDLWNMKDERLIDFAADELKKIGFIDKEDILDGTVIRSRKTYPAYCGMYEKFDIIKKFTNRFGNLFLIGRNGMHRYNNTDYSMLAAMAAVENVANAVKPKENIWEVNAEEEYHEDAG
jgi:protoporphyrinogen oxidase